MLLFSRAAQLNHCNSGLLNRALVSNVWNALLHICECRKYNTWYVDTYIQEVQNNCRVKCLSSKSLIFMSAENFRRFERKKWQIIQWWNWIHLHTREETSKSSKNATKESSQRYHCSLVHNCSRSFVKTMQKWLIKVKHFANFDLNVGRYLIYIYILYFSRCIGTQVLGWDKRAMNL